MNALSLKEVTTRKVLVNHLPQAVSSMKPIGKLAKNQSLQLVFTLPLVNESELDELIREIYRPGSQSFRRYLSSDEFARRFAPSSEQYEQVIEFARAHSLSITETAANRVLAVVKGTVEAVESAFQVELLNYKHPGGARNFHAPDREPSVDAEIPLLHIGGLNNFIIPGSKLSRIQAREHAPGPAAGSSPDGLGNFAGWDFRKAYIPQVTGFGAGQRVGVYTPHFAVKPSDISDYQTQTKLNQPPGQNIQLPAVTFKTIVTDGQAAVFTGDVRSREVTGDIEMVIAMAPGLEEVLVYEGDETVAINRMATDNLAKQLTTSWVPPPEGQHADQIYKQMAAQGQSFFAASGDDGAYYPADPPLTPGVVPLYCDDPNITIAGGTVLNTDQDGNWSSETAWHGGGGGVSGSYLGNYALPSWQEGINMTANGGSTTMRNVPDVAMVAQSIFMVFNGQQIALDGTSFSAPLWAGLTALINEFAVSSGQQPVGFLNPALYALGNSSSYSQYFHDIQSGNNTTPFNRQPGNATQYTSVPGYDLCTGWGTPLGSNLVEALALYGAEMQATNLSPALAGAGNTIYIFATTRQGRIMYNYAKVGEAGVGWHEVEGGGQTNCAPAAAAVGNHIYLAIRGLDGTVQINQADVGHAFGGWFPAGFVTDVAPAVASVEKGVYFFAKSLDGKIMYNYAPAGGAGTGWKEVDGGGQTNVATAAGSVGNHIYLAIRGLDGSIQVNQADADQPFGAWVPGNFKSDTSPAVTGVGTGVYFFAKSTDGKIMYDYALTGHAGSGWKEVEGNGRTASAPSAGYASPILFVGIDGLDGLVQINQAQPGKPFGSWQVG
jgi:hypothetical protein